MRENLLPTGLIENTVGPVPETSGYGSKTLTHSAAYVLEGSKHNASSLSSKHEKIHIQNGDNDLRELSETKVGDPKRFSKLNSGPTRGSNAEIIGTNLTCFTQVSN